MRLLAKLVILEQYEVNTQYYPFSNFSHTCFPGRAPGLQSPRRRLNRLGKGRVGDRKMLFPFRIQHGFTADRIPHVVTMYDSKPAWRVAHLSDRPRARHSRVIEAQNSLASLRPFNQADEGVADVPVRIRANSIPNVSVRQIHELENLLVKTALNGLNVRSCQSVVIVDAGCNYIFAGGGELPQFPAHYAAAKLARNVDRVKRRKPGVGLYARAKIIRQG